MRKMRIVPWVQVGSGFKNPDHRAAVLNLRPDCLREVPLVAPFLCHCLDRDRDRYHSPVTGWEAGVPGGPPGPFSQAEWPTPDPSDVELLWIPCLGLLAGSPENHNAAEPTRHAASR